MIGLPGLGEATNSGRAGQGQVGPQQTPPQRRNSSVRSVGRGWDTERDAHHIKEREREREKERESGVTGAPGLGCDEEAPTGGDHPGSRGEG